MRSIKTLALWGTLAPCLALVLSSAAVAQTPAPDATSPAAQQQQYQDQQQQYQIQERNYQEQATRYEAARDHYADARARYRRGAWPSRYEHSLVVDTSELMDARVQTANGHTVGHVEEIARTAGGHVDALRVSLDRGYGDAWIEAPDLRFDANEKLVMTNLSREDLRVMAHESY